MRSMMASIVGLSLLASPLIASAQPAATPATTQTVKAPASTAKKAPGKKVTRTKPVKASKKAASGRHIRRATKRTAAPKK